jgi:hypothetical protein
MFALRKKLTTGHPTLKEVYGSPLYGIKTGYNAAFVIDHDTRNRLINEDPRSAELLKPYLEGKDLKKWHAQSRGMWIIYIPKNQVNIDEFPAIRDWLLPFKAKLEKRATKQAWYELQQAQLAYSGSFEEPKIQYAHFCSGPLFHLNSSKHYSNDKSYIIPTSEQFIYGVLNSNTYWFIIFSITPSVRGGYHELRAQYIETLPIPKTTPAQQKTIGDLAVRIQALSEQRYVIEKQFRRRLPDLCPPDRDPKLNNKMKSWWELDFKELQEVIKKQYKSTIPVGDRSAWQDLFESEKEGIFQINNDIRLRERQLNIEVYTLFDLNAAEIALIEANT